MDAYSIFEASTTVLTLCNKLFKFFKAVYDAPEEVREYLVVLESIRLVFQDVQDYASMHLKSSFSSEDGLQLLAVQQVLKDSELEFALQPSLVEKLDPSTAKSFFSKSTRRTEWVLRKETVEELTRKLEKVQSLLILAVSTSTGKGVVLTRNKLDTVGNELHEVNTGQQQLLSMLQAYMQDLQSNTAKYMQLAGEAHIRTDVRLGDLVISMAEEVDATVKEAAEQKSRNTVLGSGTLMPVMTQEPKPSQRDAQSQSNTAIVRPSVEAAMEAAFSKFSHSDDRGASDLRQLLRHEVGICTTWEDVTLEASKAVKAYEGSKDRATRKWMSGLSQGVTGPANMSAFNENGSLFRAGTLLLLQNALQGPRDYLSVIEAGLTEASEAAMLCTREVALYDDPKLFDLLKQVYTALLTLMQVCLFRYKQRSLGSIVRSTYSTNFFRARFDNAIGDLRRLSQSVVRVVDYQRRFEMRATSERIVNMQKEQHRILATLEDQKRTLQTMKDERQVMNVVQEQQKILKVMQQIQGQLQEQARQGE